MARGITGRDGKVIEVDFGAGSTRQELSGASSSLFNPSQIPELVQEAYAQNAADEAAMRCFPLSTLGIRLVNPIYLLFFPHLHEEQLSDINSIQGIRIPGPYSFPITIEGGKSDEYAFRVRTRNSPPIGAKKLDVAVPKNGLEEVLGQHFDLQRPFDAMVITAAPMRGLIRGNNYGKVVVYVPNVYQARSIHPGSVNLRSRIAVITGNATILKEHERTFDYQALYHSL
ncbi:hypothetical protein HYY69_03770 [Candidatus Woesearchaeota archaeon]|nr:hypothetical protein [Candidatus Woesearchaeota archaeon]